jgi:hypothetical protein
VKIYAAVNSKGGAGKSSMLVAFASALHHQGKRVRILDLDSQGTLSEWLNPNNGLDPLSADELLIEAGQFAKEDAENAKLAYAHILEAEKAGGFDYLLIDTKGEPSMTAAMAMAVADMVLCPSDGSSAEYKPIMVTYRSCEAALQQIGSTADPKEKFSKQGLFEEGWQKHYPDMIEWIPASVSGGVKNINMDTMEIETDIDTFKADAASVVPAQKAGAICDRAGITDGDWCPIVPATMQTKADENIHVLGDASVANSQAKVAAMAIRGALTGSKVFDPRFANTCWSLIDANDGVKVGANYKAGAEKIEVADKFISKTGEDEALRKATYEESESWYSAISADMFS